MHRSCCVSRCLWLLCIASTWVHGTAFAEPNVCFKLSNTIVVRVQGRHLYLCQDEKVARVYLVSLGRGGVGKQTYRDLKTPLGRYELGLPRNSAQFHIYIPIGYPTEDQKK